MRRALILGIGLIVLSACGSHRVRTYGPIDLTARTVTVPPGGGLTGALKDALAQRGWRLATDRGPQITRGTTGEQTQLEQFPTFRTRYRLLVTWRQFDACLPSHEPAVTYDIALIDNQSGSEVLNMSGHGCESAITKEWIKALEGSR
jgi:hypothetical protein